MSSGAQTDAADSQGRTALILAASQGARLCEVSAQSSHAYHGGQSRAVSSLIDSRASWAARVVCMLTQTSCAFEDLQTGWSSGALMAKRLCWQLLAISTGWPCVPPSRCQHTCEVRQSRAAPGGDWPKPWQTRTSLGSAHRLYCAGVV